MYSSWDLLNLQSKLGTYRQTEEERVYVKIHINFDREIRGNAWVSQSPTHISFKTVRYRVQKGELEKEE